MWFDLKPNMKQFDFEGFAGARAFAGVAMREDLFIMANIIKAVMTVCV